MASKDQIIGALILIVCLVIAVGYVVILVYPKALADLFNSNPDEVRFWAVAIVVLIAFLAVMFIGAWIGWTMATTPPPKPIEEIEVEEAKEKGSEGEKSEG
ncbi:MAG: hypothetical protein QW804_05140 [Candidatus Bathyarchaeia archaeon]|nr:hypothetical protein [Candidatus Bathyarchaeota archaeon]